MKEINREIILDLWLKYHNTNVKEVISKHTKEELSSPEWFKLYPCSQEQYDNWKKEVKLYLKKCGISKFLIEKGWWDIELNCSPYIKQDK